LADKHHSNPQDHKTIRSSLHSGRQDSCSHHAAHDTPKESCVPRLLLGTGVSVEKVSELILVMK
jgi:hypothetical protein